MCGLSSGLAALLFKQCSSTCRCFFRVSSLLARKGSSARHLHFLCFSDAGHNKSNFFFPRSADGDHGASFQHTAGDERSLSLVDCPGATAHPSPCALYLCSLSRERALSLVSCLVVQPRVERVSRAGVRLHWSPWSGTKSHAHHEMSKAVVAARFMNPCSLS